MGGEHYRAAFFLLLRLESFVPECLQYSTTHSIGVFRSYISDTAFYQLSRRLLHWIEDLLSIKEFFFNVDTILHNPKTVNLQYTTKNNTVSLLTGHVTSFNIKPTIKVSVVDYKIRFILILGYNFFNISKHTSSNNLLEQHNSPI